MNAEELLASLRAQAFYRGQIIRVEEIEGRRAEVIGAEEACAELKHLPSLPSLLEVLGLPTVYRSLLAGWRRAFPQSEKEDERDVVLCGAPGRGRSLFIELSVILEAIDEAGLSLVLCPGTPERDRFAARLKETISRLDIAYALSVAVPSSPRDFATAFSGDFPDVVIVDPEGLAMILDHEAGFDEAPGFYDALRRVVIPSLDSWSPELLSNASVLLRRLHVEAARCGGSPSLLAASSLAKNMHEIARELWGKPLAGGAILRHQSEERVPLTVVNYGAPLVNDRSSPDRWIREDERPGAESLLKWLAGGNRGQGKMELHYVLDVSGSMSTCISTVTAAITRDLESRCQADDGLRQGDLVKLTTFESEAHPGIFRGEIADDRGESLIKDFSECVGRLGCSGGTNIAEGIGGAVESALKEQELGELQLLLFSDGASEMSAESKQKLVGMVRELRSRGILFRLVYVILDMSPPPETRNLIQELGGHIVEKSTDALKTTDSFAEDDFSGNWVVFYAGERGLPEEVTGPAAGGDRKVVYTRDLGFLPPEVDPRQIHAVVTSGVFPHRRDLLERLGCLGGVKLPVFILTPAEAHARLLTEEWPEAAEIETVPFFSPGNRELLEKHLIPLGSTGGMPLPVFQYLCQGADAYGVMSGYFRDPATALSQTPEWEESFQNHFRLDTSGPEPLVHALPSGATESPDLCTLGNKPFRISGFGQDGWIDRLTAPLVLHEGADIDWASEPAQIVKIDPDGRRLAGPSNGNLNVTLLDQVEIQVHADAGQTPAAWSDRLLGDIRRHRVGVSAVVKGIRSFKKRNFDLSPDDRQISPEPVNFSTHGLLWVPADLDLKDPDSKGALAALANLLRLTLPAIFRNASKHLLVIPDFKQGIWIIETAPGGNRATGIFEIEKDLIQRLLKLAGRLTLDCPCEGGFAGCSDGTRPAVVDTGCPRCTRTVGPVIADADGTDRFSKASKHAVLDWLLAHEMLPSSARDHLEEKYGAGVTDDKRVWLRDYGSRRAFLGLARRIYADRLGITIQEGDLPRFEWPDANEEANAIWAGVYIPAENLIKIKKGMREWQALDVFAHELFHALQHHGTAPIHPDLMGEGIPCDGKLFIEGAAVWAESHFADALAVRTMLDLNNLREGDEYGEGFRIMKWLETNHGGIHAVLRFLATGDVVIATGGRYRTLPELIRGGIS
jgi:hypothetical protein